MTTPNDEQREVARAILQAIVQRKLVQGDLAAIDAIASALAAERAGVWKRAEGIAENALPCQDGCYCPGNIANEIETAGKEGK